MSKAIIVREGNFSELNHAILSENVPPYTRNMIAMFTPEKYDFIAQTWVDNISLNTAIPLTDLDGSRKDVELKTDDYRVLGESLVFSGTSTDPSGSGIEIDIKEGDSFTVNLMYVLGINWALTNPLCSLMNTENSSYFRFLASATSDTSAKYTSSENATEVLYNRDEGSTVDNESLVEIVSIVYNGVTKELKTYRNNFLESTIADYNITDINYLSIGQYMPDNAQGYFRSLLKHVGIYKQTFTAEQVSDFYTHFSKFVI